MGAEQFFHTVSGKDPQDAFLRAVEEAQYDHGHAGYTGTIAEKDEFVMIPLPEGFPVTEAESYAEDLINHGDSRIDSKWGPAGCIDCGPIGVKGLNTYVFFGWASS